MVRQHGAAAARWPVRAARSDASWCRAPGGSTQQQLRLLAGGGAARHRPRSAAAPLDEPAHRPRIDVLVREHPRGERLLGVVGSTGTTAWIDDRPVVEIGGDEVHRRAAHLAAGLDRPPVRVQARERRQQRRMDVEHAAFVAAHEAGVRMRMKPASATRSGDASIALGQRGVEGLARREAGGRPPRWRCRARARRRGRRRAARLLITAAMRACQRFGRARAHDRLHVRAAAGDQDDDVLHRRRSVSARGTYNANRP